VRLGVLRFGVKIKGSEGELVHHHGNELEMA
jgi:hypothetical protein